jgi:hypothetical protein
MSLETHRVGTGVGNLRDLGGGAFPRSDKSSNLYTQLWDWRPFQLSQGESIDVNIASNAARLSINLQIAIKFPVPINDSGSDPLVSCYPFRQRWRQKRFNMDFIPEKIHLLIFL